MRKVSCRLSHYAIAGWAAVSIMLAVPAVSSAQTNTATGVEALNHSSSGGNVADGADSLYTSTSCTFNTAVGYIALYTDTTGSRNTGLGAYSLAYNTTGSYNTGAGYGTLYKNITGANNTAAGYDTMLTNTTGSNNTAAGYLALYLNTTGSYNNAYGTAALYNNTTGGHNIAVGCDSLYGCTTGGYNIAIGCNALYGNSTGSNNTATGYQALYANTVGTDNSAYGESALFGNTTGTYNAAFGAGALTNNTTGNNNTAVGYLALAHVTTGVGNIGLGPNAGLNVTTGGQNIDIGNVGSVNDGGAIRIGTSGDQTQTFISGISGSTVSGGVEVFINPSGQLGTIKSSARFKYDIHGIGSLSDKLMALRPVTFRYKEAAEGGTHPIQYGLIAEEVAKVYPDLVQYDKQGKPFTVYYHLLTPIMLNDLQKLHREMAAQKTEQQTQVTSLRSTAAGQSAAISSLQRTVQIMLGAFAVLVLAAIAAAVYFAIGRKSATAQPARALTAFPV